MFVSVGSGSAIGYSYDDNGDSSGKMGRNYSMEAPREEEKKKRKASVERVIMVGKKFKLVKCSTN